ncbi:Kynurenine formamidase [Halotydeus destructor]|nr:Kynurenine formamidase [Halotydeus destructor]
MKFTSVVLVVCVLSNVQADVQLPDDPSLVDLSWPFNSGAMRWVTFRNFSLEVTHAGYIEAKGTKYWMKAEDITMAIHTGTHMDAPLHFAEGKWSVDQIPITHLVNRPLAVIDARNQVSQNRDYAVTIKDIQDWEATNGQLPEGCVLFLRTGFAHHYHNRLGYIGTLTSDAKLVTTPGLHEDAAKWIVENRLVVGIGVDALSIDQGSCESFGAHTTILERNMFVIENLNTNIDLLPLTGATVNLFPMKIEGASGAPTRVIVQLNAALCAKVSIVLLVVAMLIHLF